ncbi:winged helix-turn-helix transcriptional regulator [Burkholderia gladioli]|uniref:winged helix-turn-helix transcriptional regulator n=1 Tax=Burkholderia gladioli TaxID=28095 RepID=UPI001FC81A4D|nr:helix-turn-helix domain-containing protein [Burkholderia gladioli]
MGSKKLAAITFTSGLHAALAVIGGKWKPLVLFHLAHGVHRYGELRCSVGNVSDKVLIQQLRELQLDEVIERVDYKEIPPKVEYSLTPLGHSLAKALAPLCIWGKDHMRDVERIALRRQTLADADVRRD